MNETDRQIYRLGEVIKRAEKALSRVADAMEEQNAILSREYGIDLNADLEGGLNEKT